jgi:hypothetical protein
MTRKGLIQELSSLQVKDLPEDTSSDSELINALQVLNHNIVCAIRRSDMDAPEVTTAEAMVLSKRTRSKRQYKDWCKERRIKRVGLDLWPTHRIKMELEREAKGR